MVGRRDPWTFRGSCLEVLRLIQILKPVPSLCCESGPVFKTPYLFNFLCSSRVRTTSLLKSLGVRNRGGKATMNVAKRGIPFGRG